MCGKYWKKFCVLILLLAVAAFALNGCSGGSDGAPGASTGIVSGVITSDGSHPVSGQVVTASMNSVTAATATSDASGNYSLSLPTGTYSLTFTCPANQHATVTSTVTVAAGMKATSNATVAPTGSGKPSVAVSADADQIGFGQTTNVHATATSANGTTLTYSWTGTAAPSTTGDATVTMPTLAATLAGKTAPATDPGGYYGAYTQEDRFGILPINPDHKGAATATVTVSDGLGGTTTASITVNAAGVTTGLRNVAVGVPVYLNSGHADPHAWTLTAAPGSSAALRDAATRNASFTPDVAGKYTVTEGANTMNVYAGNWVGAIEGGTEDAAGLPSVTASANCTICHDNNLTIAPDKFSPWAQTPHATFFATGLNGLTSNRDTCTTCHTVGYDGAPLADNNGYDDLVRQTGWKYPTTRQKGNWAAMWADAKGKQVGPVTNIQCENCHGPNSTAGHKTTTVAGVTNWGLRTSVSADVCATCHASGTGHHNYSEWQQIDPDTGYGHSKAHQGNASFSGSGHCARCHTGQGFLTYLKQLNAGNIGSLAGTLSNIVTAQNAEGVTCSACHDPHDGSVSGIDTSTGVPKSAQLRVFNDTPLLPAGFSVKGMGAGALCFTCHNSRNGARSGSTTLTYLHEDGETYNSGNPTTFSAPHQAAQGDVLAGRNAYFMGAGTLPMVSKHANVAESCVGCHMNLNPQTHLSHGAATPSRHVMFIRDRDKGKVCANCHGATNGEALVASVESGLAAIKAKMEASLQAKLALANAGSPYYMTIYPTDGNGVILTNATGGEVKSATAQFVFDNSNPLTSIVAEEVHGQNGFLITLTNDETYTISGASYTFKQFEVQLGAIFDKTNPGSGDADTVYKLNGNLVRAGWNYYLIEGDQSKGIHNPTFANMVINNTLQQDLTN